MAHQCLTVGRLRTVKLFYDTGRNILLTQFNGQLNDPTLDAATDAARMFVRQHGLCHGLLDYTEVSSIDLSPTTVSRRAGIKSIVHGMTRVFVAPGDLNFGYCRMFQITQDVTHGDWPHVVRSIQEAHVILRINTDNFLPVDVSAA